jgi:cell division protein FtsQ
LRPVSQEKNRSGTLGVGRTQTPQQGASRPSWFSIAEAHADVAARAGFLVSMAFLAAATLYALHLSGATKIVFDEIAETADRVAYDAGFRLEDLAVSGTRHTPKETLLKALDLPYSKSSIFYDAAEAHDRLLQLGWISGAEVRRILPSRLEVVLTEREPFARWADSTTKEFAIDREGHILGSTEGQFETLLLFAGEGAPAEAAELFDALSDHQTIKQRIARAELVAERFWQLTLDNGLILKLPRKVNELVLGRIESLLANNKIAEMALETIDLRLTNRTILQLREPTLANRDKAISSLTTAAPQPFSPTRRGRAL